LPGECKGLKKGFGNPKTPETLETPETPETLGTSSGTRTLDTLMGVKGVYISTLPYNTLYTANKEYYSLTIILIIYKDD
jgi:hypothetical protein